MLVASWNPCSIAKSKQKYPCLSKKLIAGKPNLKFEYGKYYYKKISVDRTRLDIYFEISQRLKKFFLNSS